MKILGENKKPDVEYMSVCVRHGGLRQSESTMTTTTTAAGGNDSRRPHATEFARNAGRGTRR